MENILKILTHLKILNLKKKIAELVLHLSDLLQMKKLSDSHCNSTTLGKHLCQWGKAEDTLVLYPYSPLASYLFFFFFPSPPPLLLCLPWVLQTSSHSLTHCISNSDFWDSYILVFTGYLSQNPFNTNTLIWQVLLTSEFSFWFFPLHHFAYPVGHCKVTILSLSYLLSHLHCWKLSCSSVWML